ncbi:MAG: hypothetical protein PUP92_06600 [Rhizonema sp. PD38]|nr:hypothetical protein [Rhizonema sp. PD38]
MVPEFQSMGILNKLSILAIEISFLSLGFTTVAQAASFITTDNLQNREGNSSLGFLVPFPSRFQQVYSNSQFGSKPLEISQIALRPDAEVSEPFDFTIGDIQFYLSTTSRNPDELSSHFEENLGSDYTQVFDGEWKISSKNIASSGGIKNFDIVLNFLKPFIYDPTKGNLLLEYKKFTPEITGSKFDSEFVFDDSISTEIAAGDANALNAAPQFSSTLGLVTQFKVTSVPEPSSLLSSTLIVTFLSVATLKFQRTRRKKEVSLPLLSIYKSSTPHCFKN